jgi:hypothetical protein
MFKNLPDANASETIERYNCPICRYGKVQSMPLMETLGCNGCGYLFFLDPINRSLRIADSTIPLTWYWNGKRWQGVPNAGNKMDWGTKLLAGITVLLPPLLVGLSAYVFPPDPSSALSWFPTAWTVLTFLSHLGLVMYLVGEYYQFPYRLYLQSTLRHWFFPLRRTS